MNQATAIKPDAAGNRPVYTGLDWAAVGAAKAQQWTARSEATPVSYVVQEIEGGRWSARQGFRDRKSVV